MQLLPSSRRLSGRRGINLIARRCYALDLRKLDDKWQRIWECRRQPVQVPEASKKVVLPMFPYPSGSLHLGHLRVYTVADVVARFYRLQGHAVTLPMGWDAFGLPAENAALERGIRPDEWTASNIAKMKQQLQLINGSWDWQRELATSDPGFYKHTQKLFLMLYERGLAYLAEADVNYDPVDKTVLANEQVDANGCSWRSGAKVEKRRLKQWFLRISHFRQPLLHHLESLAKDGAWPERVLAQQRNWLGKSTGATIKFPLMSLGVAVEAAVSVFTTRPDTLFGAQYIALASTHPLVVRLAESDPELQAFLDTLPGLPPGSKVGYLLPQLRAVNPLAYHQDTPEATKAAMPIYVASYVVGGYGEGAVMGVPGHDARDHDFWRTHRKDEPIRIVLAASEDESTTVMENKPFLESGIMTAHSGPFKGKSSVEAGQMLLRMLEQAGLAEQTEKWRLRDWLISRQRYWGAPIPVVHCDSCGPVAVPDEQLPVELPRADGHWVEGKAGNALESSPDFIETRCPRCGGCGRRDTDTMDTFVDSSWYYARFADPHNADQPISAEAAAKGLPVDVYIGGVEHAILHLLYARFIYKFLATTPLLPQYGDEATALAAEPFKRLITQGMVQGKTYADPDSGRFLRPDEVDLSDPAAPKVAATGAKATVTFEKMSKSKHNGVDPTDTIARHGADATRAHMLFQAPVGEVLRWDEGKIPGVTRWLQRLYEQVMAVADFSDVAEPMSDYLGAKYAKLDDMSGAELKRWDAEAALWLEVQRTIGSVTESYREVYSLNTVVSDLMSMTNALVSHGPAAGLVVRRQAVDTVVRLAAPVTPAFAEECWAALYPSKGSVFETASFPVEDGSGSAQMLQPRVQQFAVQVNGKVRGTVMLRPPPGELDGNELAEWLTGAVVGSEQGGRFREGEYDVRKAKRVVAVKGARVVSFVV
ncbi:hypothetical protein XA68_17328 [Ophiocordyceps unilateralis]|uniref:leucine--tRNA ligase n=1 Tax=Ophiocordyceps unilateralis TaxID=268505 RepID=A0A2A9P3P3_OPHUN|nr:hypothetical protein XA68_17328 [Ophiocordyceps unilateralis]